MVRTYIFVSVFTLNGKLKKKGNIWVLAKYDLDSISEIAAEKQKENKSNKRSKIEINIEKRNKKKIGINK